MVLRLAPDLYVDLKQLIMERDEWKCRFCKIRNCLHVHHIVYRSEMGSDTSPNLITLCSSCHEAVHDFRLAISCADERVGADGVLQFVAVRGWRPGS